MEDLLGAGRRFGDRLADLLERAGDRVDVLAPFADHLARLAHLVRDHGGVSLDLVHELADLVGAASGALGELADLVRNDGKAATSLAGAGRLDRGVQREQVRAVRDARYDLRDLMHVAGLGFELEDLAPGRFCALEDRLHLFDGETRDLDAGARLLVGLGSEAEGLPRAARVEIDLARNLVHAQGRLVEKLLLLGHALRHLRHGVRDLFARRLQAIERGFETGRRSRHGVGRRLDLRHELTQASEHSSEAVGEIVHLVAQRRVRRPHDVDLQVALAYPLGRVPHRFELRPEHAGGEETDPAADAEGNEEADAAAPEVDA